MTARVVHVDDLPDGRRLLVYEDGRSAVSGRAVRRAHPVPGWEWLGAHPVRPAAPRSRRPNRAPRPSPVPGTRPAFDRFVRPPVTRPPVGSEAHRRADALLDSLLDAAQRSDYRATGGFWVPTPRGPVRLGRLYELIHHPSDRPLVQRVLCVVPGHHDDLPLPDVWTNLLLTLAVEPDEFFRVARERAVTRRR